MIKFEHTLFALPFALMGMLLAAWRLNPLCLDLSPVAIAILLGYSYTKRFTFASHVVLGLALGGAPLGAWIAVRGSLAATPVLLCAVVVTWVAGFDVLYALQDEHFDRATGLHSVPARFGTLAALWCSALLHLVTIALLAALPFVYPPGLGVAYAVGVAGCVALLAWQHAIVRPRDLSRLNAAFFNANGLLSVWLAATLAVDLLAGGR
jgi:4-hydroxybenzoate polyprenyltransferase